MHMVANDGENAAVFDARRAAALLELVTDKLEKKHALRRATVPTTAEALPSEPSSPRAERRAAARSEAEDQVLDPPESRNREKSRTARRKQRPGKPGISGQCPGSTNRF